MTFVFHVNIVWNSMRKSVFTSGVCFLHEVFFSSVHFLSRFGARSWRSFSSSLTDRAGLFPLDFPRPWFRFLWCLCSRLGHRFSSSVLSSKVVRPVFVLLCGSKRASGSFFLLGLFSAFVFCRRQPEFCSLRCFFRSGGVWVPPAARNAERPQDPAGFPLFSRGTGIHARFPCSAQERVPVHAPSAAFSRWNCCRFTGPLVFGVSHVYRDSLPAPGLCPLRFPRVALGSWFSSTRTGHGLVFDLCSRSSIFVRLRRLLSCDVSDLLSIFYVKVGIVFQSLD
jgi:hypothetical protein